MDGVPYLTTPPIEAGGSHEFRFRLVQSGTYWYHSHTNLQEQQGVYGTIVILPRGGLSQKADHDYVLALSDWTHENPDTILRTLKRGSDWYSIRKGQRQSISGAAARPGGLANLWQRSLRSIPQPDVSDVAYDTFLAVTQRMSGLRRWAIRCQVMALVSVQFWYSNFQRMADFFRQDGMNTPRTWWRVAKYLLVKPGMMRRIFWDYLRFYAPGFHPWHRDDRKLIARIETQLTLTPPPAAA